MSVPLDAELAIAEIVEAMLPRFSPEGEALYIHLDLRANYYPEDVQSPELADSRGVHLIFERPSNYTKVWACVNKEWSVPPPEVFTLRSNHDSCWRTDGFRDLSQTYVAVRRGLADKISDHNLIRAIRRVKIDYASLDPKHPITAITMRHWLEDK